MLKYGPLLAYTFAMRFAATELINLHKDLMESIKKNDFSSLDLTHHLSAGFKAAFSKLSYEGIDTIRQSCGGAGYLAWSALPLL